jgi:serine/threonine-protein kinase HipA
MWPPPQFFELHTGLPREGPGDDSITQRAVELLPELPPNPVVVDVGCGPGGQTLVLARALGVKVTGIDIHPPFVEVLERRAEAAGLAHLIEAREGDMSALPFDRGTVDLIWCEGAIYFLGLRDGLILWRPLLAEGGIVALSEAVWTVEEPPAEAREMWEQWYPAITDAMGCIAQAADAGYETLDHFTLPPESWWTHYYGPMEERVEELRPRAADDPVLAQVLTEAELEMDIHRRFGHTYSYEFLILKKH